MPNKVIHRLISKANKGGVIFFIINKFDILCKVIKKSHFSQQSPLSVQNSYFNAWANSMIFAPYGSQYLDFDYFFAGGGVGFGGEVDGHVGLQGQDSEFELCAVVGQAPQAVDKRTAVVEIVVEQLAVVI